MQRSLKWIFYLRMMILYFHTELVEYLEAPEFVSLLRAAKVYGFSDFQIARALGMESRMSMTEAGLMVRSWRKELGIVPTVNQIDTLAAEYPDLYAGCMFVDGQWDVSALSGLENQPFVYFAAEDDTSAWAGAQEVMAMFDADAVSYAYAQWDGGWSVDELSSAAQDLFATDEDQYFISWATGTIEPVSGGMGGAGADMGSPSYHMASFDYAYNCVAAMEWLFQQRR